MKPRRLRLQAFGPFADSAEVDFDRMADIGLFVVAGPTGAGKTSLFDGLCYGLYGRLAGSREQHGDVRSDHADVGVATEVTVEFDASGDRWRVWRHPRQVRPKRRGSGTTVAAPAASLHRWDGAGWQPVESRWEPVTQRCRQLVGLDADQFQQVVLLPQGRFEEVLNARSSDRQVLLRTLFRSDAFRQGQDWLEARARELEARVRSVEEQRASLLAGALQALVQADLTLVEQAVEPAGAPRGGGDDEREGFEALVERLAELRQGPMDQLARLARDAERAAEAAEQAADRAEQQRNAFRRRSTLRSRLEQLDRDEDRQRRRQVEVDRASRAATVQRARSELDQHERDTASAAGLRDQWWERARQACREAELDLDPSPQDDGAEECRLQAEMRLKEMVDLALLLDRAAEHEASARRLALRLDEVQVERDRCRRRVQDTAARLEAIASDRERLQALAGTVVELRAERERALGRCEARRRHDQVSGRLERSGARLEALDAELAALGDEDERNRVAQQEARLAAAEVPAARQELQRWELQQRRRRSLADHVDRLAEADRALLAARSGSDSAFARFLTGTASRLAGTLRDGEPCLVCGSAEHPRPAAPPDGGHLVDEAEVDVAARAAARAEAERSDVAASLRALAQELGPDADRDVEALSDEVERARQHLERSSAAAAGLGNLVTRAAALAEQRRALQLERDGLDDLVRSLRTARAELAGALGQAVDVEADVLSEALHQADAAVARAASAEEALVALGDERTTLVEAKAGDEAAVVRLTAEAASLDQEVRNLRDQAQAWRAEVSSVVAPASPAELASRARAALDAIAAARRALSRWEEQRRERDQVARRLDQALTSSGLGSLEEAAAAARPAELVQRWEAGVRAWHEERLGVRAALDVLDAQGLPDVEPDVEVLRQQAGVAADRRRAVAAACGSVAAHAQHAGQRLDEVRLLDQAHGPMLDDARLARTAAEVVRGRNRRNATLEAWVLSAHLREVVEHANQHLDAMSRGRFQLAVSDDVVDARARAGLDLVVHDSFSGRARPTVTLSGGETFQASLSLALGLADVVTAGRAGLRLDALFVDEGFGSLDADALEQAIDVLDGLRSRGALVGVVTHVESMKAALPVALEVVPRADRRGSVVHQRS